MNNSKKAPNGRAAKPMATLNRLLKYIKKYKFRFLIVLACILISAFVGVVGSTFVQTLVDDYIMPMIQSGSHDFSDLAKTLFGMGIIFLCGVTATLFYNRLMVTVAQGVLRDLREEMFEHMQSLTIRYFDTHSHGDMMSCYTNDTDTLRQMLTQSVPQMFSSAMTIICVFVAMLVTSPHLTVVVLVFVAIMILLTKIIGGRSGKYFLHQQQALGTVNGYIEEMINGQKVIKVFCHEEDAEKDFEEKNNYLFKQAEAANKFANILMPIMNNLGNIEYVVVAIVGASLVIGDIGGITIGSVVAFMLSLIHI